MCIRLFKIYKKKVVVSSLEIFRIPRPVGDDLDNVVVGARMDVMEKKMEGMDKNVTELLRNFKDMIENQTKQNTAVTLQVPGLHAHAPANAGNPRGYAAAAAAGTAAANGNTGQKQFRQRLDSKRKFDEINDVANANNENSRVTTGQQLPGQGDWNDAKVRKPRKVAYGKAKVTTLRSDEAVAPYEVFITNTHPGSRPDLIKEILIECSTADSTREALEIIDVKCMTNKEKIINPRTLCWKVTVPHRERDYMLKDESYPEGWAHRRFFQPRSSTPLLKPSLPAAKMPRMNVNNVEMIGA